MIRSTFALAAAATLLSGCASHEFVNRKLADLDAQHTTALGTVDSNAKAASSAAMDRANAAYTLAEGKFQFAETLSDAAASFTAGRAVLSDDAKAHLADLATKLNGDNKNLYLEIQGHTDNLGNEGSKFAIGQARAEAVRLYLNQQGIALNRMAVISYSDTKPVADNKTEQGRAANRRVVILGVK